MKIGDIVVVRYANKIKEHYLNTKTEVIRKCCRLYQLKDTGNWWWAENDLEIIEPEDLFE